MKVRCYYVYMMSNRYNTVLYVGVTNNLYRRTREHKNHVNRCFTARYNVEKLVYYEIFNDIRTAIRREKQLKNWKREWKNQLVNGFNQGWVDLTPPL